MVHQIRVSFLSSYCVNKFYWKFDRMTTSYSINILNIICKKKTWGQSLSFGLYYIIVIITITITIINNVTNVHAWENFTFLIFFEFFKGRRAVVIVTLVGFGLDRRRRGRFVKCGARSTDMLTSPPSYFAHLCHFAILHLIPRIYSLAFSKKKCENFVILILFIILLSMLYPFVLRIIRIFFINFLRYRF